MDKLFDRWLSEYRAEAAELGLPLQSERRARGWYEDDLSAATAAQFEADLADYACHRKVS